VIDGIAEIPLSGRTLCGSSVDAAGRAMRVAVPSFVAGQENLLLASAVNGLLAQPADDPLTDADAPAASAALPAVLALFGPSGTGKTHLARGLVQHWQQRCGAEAAAYFTATDWRHALTDAIKTNSVGAFRDRVRGLRLLAMDDLDRLPNSDYLQQELRYTLDACAEHGGLVVVTSSHAPGTLRSLSAGVRNRLRTGLELRLAPPGDESRAQIVRYVAAALGAALTDEAAARLAAGVDGTAHDVFGAVFELFADLAGRGGDDRAWVERYLARRAARRPGLRDILRVVAKYYGVPQKLLKSSSRRQSVVTARAMVVYLARQLSRLSYERIGDALGGRDHTTMIHSYRKIARLSACDPATREAIEELYRILNFNFAQPTSPGHNARTEAKTL